MDRTAGANGNYYSKMFLRKRVGYGITEAARGFLGSERQQWQDKVSGNNPTAWNASPRDENGVPGAMEQSLINTC